MNTPLLGSRWRERDKRSRKRVVEVVGATDNWITVITVFNNDGRLVIHGRTTTIRPDIFRTRWVPADVDE